MKITIKGLKHSEFASHETHCFEASVYVDGKRAFSASNDGFGGPNNYYPLPSKGKVKNITGEVRKVEDYLKTLPKTQCDGFSIQEDLDCVIGDLVNKTLVLKDAKRGIKKKIVGYIPSKGGIFEWKCAINAANKAQIKKKHKDIVILNDLDDDKLYEYYSKG